MKWRQTSSRGSTGADRQCAPLRLSRLTDDPGAWSVPVARLLGVRIRLHALLLMLIVAEMLRSTVFSDREAVSGPAITATALLALLLVVFAHEIGKALMTRWMGGSAETIVLWPLGGLAEHQQAAAWRRRLIGSCGGLLLSLVLASALWPILIEHTPNWYSTITHPLDPGASYGEWVLVYGRPAWWLSLLWWVAYVNYVVLAANLLPAYPLDGAAVLSSALGAVLGRRRGERAAIIVALVLAVIILFAAVLMQQVLGVVLGGFALWCSVTAARRHAFLEEQPVLQEAERATPAPELLPDDSDEIIRRAPRSVSNLETSAFQVRLEAAPDTQKKVAPRLRNPVDPAEAEDKVLDRILAKISAEGMAALTEQERKILESVTARRRRG